MKRFFALFAVLVLLAAGCASDDAATSTTGFEPTTSTSGAPTTSTTAVVSTTTGEPPPEVPLLSGLAVIDENTFTVELVEADPEFLLKLENPAYFALPDSAFKDPTAQDVMPIGNGPFMMAEPWGFGDRVFTVRNPDYQGSDPAKVESMEFVELDHDSAFVEFLAGDLDIAVLRVDDREIVPGSATIAEADRAVIGYLGVPTYLDQFTKEHRRALSMAIDREQLAETFWKVSGKPAHAIIPPALGGRDHVCENWNHNPEEARALWDAAGDPGDIVISIYHPGEFGHWDLMYAVKSMWVETLGIDPATVRFENPWSRTDPFEPLTTGTATGPYYTGWGQDYPSPLSFLEPLFASYRHPDLGGSNTAFYDNPAFDAAIATGKEKLAETGRIDDATADFEAAEEILCEDLPVIPMSFNVTRLAHVQEVSGVHADWNGELGCSLIGAPSGTVSVHVYDRESRFPRPVLHALNTGLVEFDPRDNRPFNAHAHSVSSDDGGKTWTIVLNPGWTFHDGTPNDAASYVNAWSFRAERATEYSDIISFENIVGFQELNPTAAEG